MNARACRITFRAGTSRWVIEKAVVDAMFAAECLHGAARVRLGAGYFLGRGREPQCVIDTTTDIGEQVAQLFTGIASRALGEDAFHVERIRGEVEPMPA
jgi:hypothetical protein